MANFVYKLNGKVTKPGDVTDVNLRKSFDQLKAKISNALGPLQCSEHELEPIIFLESDGSGARLGGFTSCCEASATEAKKRLEKVTELAGAEFTVRTMVRPKG